MSIEKTFDIPPNKLTLKNASYAWQQSQAKFVIELGAELGANIDALFKDLENALFYNTKQKDEKDINNITIDDM